MTMQEIFNRVCEHAVTQNAKSENYDCDSPVYGCAYRGDDGRKCFLGVLITDEAYDPDLEGKTVASCSVRRALESSGIQSTGEPRKWYFLSQLQDVHDDHEPHEWPRELRNLGDKYNLAIPACILDPTR